MAGYNYFASPYNSPRAMSFRETYGNAIPGQNFMFENQPYDGPPAPSPPALNFPGGLYGEEGPGTATGYVKKDLIPESDQAYMSPEMRARIDAERMRLGERIGGRSKVLRDRSVWDHFEKRWVEPEGSFAQSPHGLDALEQQNLNIITGDRSPQGLLEPGYAGQNRTEVEGLRQQLAQGRIPPQSGLLADNSNTNQYTDKSGWEKDKQWSKAGEMLMLFGSDYMRENPFGDGR